MRSTKIIVRLKGGLGNQLFCYAAARRLSLASDAELVIDDVTGFIRDRQYRRRYAMDNFCIPVRKATPHERMEPFERYRRGLAKFTARYQPFHERTYIEQERENFDPRLLEFRPKRTIYIDGLWQSEDYFKDVEAVIRQDLKIIPPQDYTNREIGEKIRGCNSVCVHMRWYSKHNAVFSNNVELSYYFMAVNYIMDIVPNPHFFIFSDDPDVSCSRISLPNAILINHNNVAEKSYADLWLMSQCKYFIIGNSTFSWWGAWLAESESKIVFAPEIKQSGITVWPFEGLIPRNWILVPADKQCCTN